MYYFASDIHLGLQIGSDPENRVRPLVFVRKPDDRFLFAAENVRDRP